MNDLHDYERLKDDEGDEIQRLHVPGGWIYYGRRDGVFVPDPKIWAWLPPPARPTADEGNL